MTYAWTNDFTNPFFPYFCFRYLARPLIADKKKLKLISGHDCFKIFRICFFPKKLFISLVLTFCVRFSSGSLLSRIISRNTEQEKLFETKRMWNFQNVVNFHKIFLHFQLIAFRKSSDEGRKKKSEGKNEKNEKLFDNFLPSTIQWVAFFRTQMAQKLSMII